MKRTTIMLPEELKNQAERSAATMGISLGELIRESLEARLKTLKRPRSEDPLFSNAPIFQDLVPPDLSERHDDYLYGADD
jgi:hypothetical protein